jgi:hypothetical protein
MRVVIEHDGTIVDVDRLTCRLMGLPSNVAVLDYVVEIIGFIWFEITEKGCRIYLHPKKIQSAMEASLYRILLEQRPQRVLVSFAVGTGLHRIYASAAEAIAGIASVLWEQRPQRSRRFASRSVNIATLQGFPSLQYLLDAYLAGQGSVDLLQWQELLVKVVQNRFLIVERVGREDTLLVRAVGAGYSAFDTNWATKSAGTPLDEQPDVDYGTWLAKGYLGVLARKQAQVEEVDAVIYRPRYGRRRFTYRRLMLPFAIADGRQLVLSTSVADPSVDLSLDQATEAQ